MRGECPVNVLVPHKHLKHRFNEVHSMPKLDIKQLRQNWPNCVIMNLHSGETSFAGAPVPLSFYQESLISASPISISTFFLLFEAVLFALCAAKMAPPLFYTPSV